MQTTAYEFEAILIIQLQPALRLCIEMRYLTMDNHHTSTALKAYHTGVAQCSKILVTHLTQTFSGSRRLDAVGASRLRVLMRFILRMLSWAAPLLNPPSPLLPADALADIAAGKFVVVTDDADRENEGDLIMAAQHMTPEKMHFMVRRPPRSPLLSDW